MKKNGLVKEDACDGTKWRGVVKTITMTLQNPVNSVDKDNTVSTCDDDQHIGLPLICFRLCFNHIDHYS